MTGSTTARSDIKAFARLPVLLVAAAFVIIEMIFAGRYDYHRDELYFLVSSGHIAWGYVDQPPLTVLLAWPAHALNDNIYILHLVPALTAGALVMVSALIAQTLGCDKRGQVLTAVCVAAAPLTQVMAHSHNTVIVDLLIWAAAFALLVRLLRFNSPRYWLPIGIACGFGVLNKVSVLQFAGFTSIAMLAFKDSRSLMKSRYLVYGFVIAAVMSAPYFIWQAQHGWPQIAMFRVLAKTNYHENPGLQFLIRQPLLTNPVASFVWLIGAVQAFRTPALKPYRPIVVSYLAFIVFYTAQGAAEYYAFGFYPLLFALGASWLQERASDRSLRISIIAVAVAGLIAVPITLPALSPSMINTVGSLNGDVVNTYGWSDYAHEVLELRERIPQSEQAHTIVLTHNLGEEGAVEHYGGSWGKAHTYSGHNSLWYYRRPPDEATVVIAVGFDEATLRKHFASVEWAGSLHNRAGVVGDGEHDTPLFICRNQYRSWTVDWPSWKRIGV